MTEHSFTGARDGLPAGPAPDTTTAARSRAAGGTGPGVPLSVWPGLPAPDSPACGGPVTAAAALRVITAFSVPGDMVAAAGCQPAVTVAAAAAGRAVLALAPDACGGDPPGGPCLAPAAGSPAAGRAALAVAGCPGCLSRQQSGRDAGLLYAACERALRPGGVLAVIAGPAAEGGTAGGIVAAARAAGLVYAQHIVLVRAAIDGDRLDPAAPDPGPGPDLPGPVHDDLLVFTKPGGARP